MIAVKTTALTKAYVRRRSEGVRGAFLGAWVAGLVAVLAASAPAAAFDVQGKFAVKGAARTSCERFVKARNERRERPLPNREYISWLNGYFTALNEVSSGTYDLMSFESTELLAELVYKNCERQPKTAFFPVVRELARALGKTRLPLFSEFEIVEGDLIAQDGTTRSVKLRMYRETIRRLQSTLQAQSLYEGKIDGLYSDATRAAVKAYQEKSGLPASSMPDQPTLLRIFHIVPALERRAAGGQSQDKQPEKTQ